MTDMVETSAPAQHTVRAGINEKRFFESMNHMFASSFSVLGELMQNSRRAGASRVEFEVDPVGRTLRVRDNGAGIADFALLVKLCESGWDEQTTLTERPFGMGLFSLLFVGRLIRFRSRSQLLELSLDDVVNKRDLCVRADPLPVTAGTVIEVLDLGESFLKRRSQIRPRAPEQRVGGELEALELTEALVHRASGFPIEVTLNRTALERPYARDNLAGEQTSIGFISLAGMHRPGQLPSHGSRAMKLFLQGLPIGPQPEQADIIVHLDPTKFTARMPDRSHLVDHSDRQQEIASILNRCMVEFLARQKAAMTGQAFVTKYWYVCDSLGCMQLMDDVPWIPRELLVHVADVTEDRHENTYRAWSPEVVDELVARADIAEGRVKVWLDAPDGPSDSAVAALVLKVMQRESIATVIRQVPPSHWLSALASRVEDLRFKVTAANVRGEAVFYTGGWCQDCTVRLADNVEVLVTSAVDPNFRLCHVVTDDWLLLPADYQEAGFEQNVHWGNFEALCYVIGDGAACDHPTRAFDVYSDDTDRHRDDWAEEAAERWNSLVSGLRGESLAVLVRQALAGASQQPSDCHLSHLALVATCRTEYAEGRFGPPLWTTTDLQADGFWEQVAQQLEPGSPVASVQDIAARVRRAFEAVARPGEVQKSHPLAP